MTINAESFLIKLIGYLCVSDFMNMTEITEKRGMIISCNDVVMMEMFAELGSFE